jgi:hypothetical protein
MAPQTRPVMQIRPVIAACSTLANTLGAQESPGAVIELAQELSALQVHQAGRLRELSKTLGVEGSLDLEGAAWRLALRELSRVALAARLSRERD